MQQLSKAIRMLFKHIPNNVCNGESSDKRRFINKQKNSLEDFYSGNALALQRELQAKLPCNPFNLDKVSVKLIIAAQLWLEIHVQKTAQAVYMHTFMRWDQC